MSTPSTFEEILAQARLAETTVTLCLRGDLDARFRDLERQLADADRTPASLGERSEAARIAEQIEAVRAEMAASQVTFRLRAMPALGWAALLDTLPDKPEGENADPEAKERWRAGYFDWFCGLVARCCIDPEMKPDQVAQLVEHLSGPQWDTLGGACWALNAKEVDVPFSAAASALTRESAPNSRPPSPSTPPARAGSAANPAP